MRLFHNADDIENIIAFEMFRAYIMNEHGAFTKLPIAKK